MSETRRWVEVVLYGTGSLQRFTQHSPILGDVWAGYFDKRAKKTELLIQPWRSTPPYETASALLDRISPEVAKQEDRHDEISADITCNRTVVVADLTLEEVINHVLPMSGWYVSETASAGSGGRKPARRKSGKRSVAGFDGALPSVGELWADVADIYDSSRSIDYPYPRLLSMVRIAGLIAYTEDASKEEVDRYERNLNTLLDPSSTSGQTKAARDELAEVMLAGFRKRIGGRLPKPASRKLVYAINLNRPATLALRNSVRTVKADAAKSLFDIKCDGITWAIIDSGIDARHSAFRDWNQAPEDGKRTPLKGQAQLTCSRVKRTFDFSYLREILLGKLDHPNVPRKFRNFSKKGAKETKAEFEKRQDTQKEIVRRVRVGQAVDWAQLLPFIEIEHKTGSYTTPVNNHGTHVAGILGADWREEQMLGVCPDINLFDVRICKPDGSSDEFVIMSALQFLRYLNANSDFMAVHGVNMSLSLLHDAANYACGQTPICTESERTVSAGMVVVAAAGNNGFRRVLGARNESFDQYYAVSITDPGNAEEVITVGSTHRLEPHTYGVSYFSSRGPTGDGRVKPDLVAPGEKILGPAPNNGDVTLDGTSMSAPHVSGAAALLMARHTELNGRPRRIKQILCETATDLGRERYFQGHGLVDILRAIQSV